MENQNNNLYSNFFKDLESKGSVIDPKQKERISAKITSILTYRPKVGIFGKSGVGKSSLCNALFGKDVAEISDIAACTRKPQEILLGIGEKDKGIILVDVPGLGETAERDIEYIKLYQNLIPELDIILWILKADERAYSLDQNFYITNIKPHLEQKKPFLIVLNQIDKIHPFKEWNNNERKPGPTQLSNIQEKKDDVARTFNYPTSKILEVSAEERFNLIHLVDEMIYALPDEKKMPVLNAISSNYVSPLAEASAVMGVAESALKGVGGDLLAYFNEDWRKAGESAGQWLGKGFDKISNWFK